MKQLAMVLIIAGAGTLIIDLIATSSGKHAVFFGPGGVLANVQAKAPVPLDLTMLGAGVVMKVLL